MKIPIGLEDEDNKDIPLSVDLYRPIRQHVYAVLFDVRKPCPIGVSSGSGGSSGVGGNGSGAIDDGSVTTNTPVTNGKGSSNCSTRNGDSPSDGSGAQNLKEVFIKEWVVRKHNGLQCEPVKARPFEWKSTVPSCMQLW